MGTKFQKKVYFTVTEKLIILLKAQNNGKAENDAISDVCLLELFILS